MKFSPNIYVLNQMRLYLEQYAVDRTHALECVINDLEAGVSSFVELTPEQLQLCITEAQRLLNKATEDQ